ncbi:MAG: hypothetical protein J6W04_00695 [Bacteroidales bacterium]|nr:hypothetical protein [Bacteroidales bacterium]
MAATVLLYAQQPCDSPTMDADYSTTNFRVAPPTPSTTCNIPQATMR